MNIDHRSGTVIFCDVIRYHRITAMSDEISGSGSKLEYGGGIKP
jgi:hypothetical protein